MGSRPPVVEVVFGIRFQELEGYRSTTAGTLWQRLRDRYPRTEDAAPLGEEIGAAVVTLPPHRRTFFIDASERWVVQVQPDRFFHNWRRRDEADAYPGFDDCLARFLGVLGEFNSFCASELGRTPAPVELHLAYINHLIPGEHWDAISSTTARLPTLGRWPHGALPPDALTWRLEAPTAGGKLSAGLQTAATREGSERLVLDFTVRAAPPSVSPIDGWFRTARESAHVALESFFSAEEVASWTT